MIGARKKLRLLAARAALAAMVVFVGLSTADAQWFPPIGAASPHEIAERLRAGGYALIGPLQRRDTVYLADVHTGAAGRERLVIDAWSGEILQRFVARRGYARPGLVSPYVVEGGEFDSPPPLGPPPVRDFTGGPRSPKLKISSKLTGASHKQEEPKPTTATTSPPPQPEKADEASVHQSAPVAPPSAPAVAPEASQQPSAPATGETAPTRPAESVAPKSEAPSAAEPKAKGAARSAASSQPAAPAPAVKPSAKEAEKSRVNDVPVTTPE
jgi:hypothetical protein